jgi:hypothetical protein
MYAHIIIVGGKLSKTLFISCADFSYLPYSKSFMANNIETPRGRANLSPS